MFSARNSIGQFSLIVVVVYWPGSSAVQLIFFEELPVSTTDQFNVVATFQEAVIIVDNFSIHLEHSDDPITKRLADLPVTTGFQFDRLQLQNTSGTNDAVIARCIINDSQLNVSVVDVGLSDTICWPGHFLVARCLQCPKPYGAARGASWTSLIMSVPVHHVARRHWRCMAAMYESEISDDCYSGPSYSFPRSHATSQRV